MTQKSISKTTVNKNGLTEEEYLLRYNSDKYPKPALTADICVFLKEKLLLIRRKNHPFIHHLALPGGFANKNEPIEETALRELKEETGLDGRDMKLIGVYSRPGRDPRGWTVSAAYMYEISEEEAKKLQADDDAEDAGWYEVTLEEGILKVYGSKHEDLSEELAFDHPEIIRDAFRQRTEK